MGMGDGVLNLRAFNMKEPRVICCNYFYKVPEFRFVGEIQAHSYS